ncbi:MAG: DUF4838 domain-containing protein [Clostridia bacterium]|nr:DUF4838 domain-containing protein [Clostridia bacterium]
MSYKIFKLTDHPVVDFAAAELKKYLRMMMPEAGDISLARTTDKNMQKTGYVLGLLQDFGLDTSEARDLSLDDIIHIDTTDCAGVIAGSNPRSVLLATYRFLQQNGCRWLYPGIDGEYIPVKAVDAVFYHKMADARYRGQCNEGAESQQCMLETIDFTPKIGMNVYMIEFDNPFTYYNDYYNHRGNTVNRRAEPVSYDTVKQWKRQCECEIEKRGLQFHDMGHGWTAEPFGISSIEGWKKVPEESIPEQTRQYLAYRKGGSAVASRRFCGGVPLNTNICMSNPAARALVVKGVADYAEAHTNVDYTHVWLADACNNHCECEACREKRPADWYVIMMNELDEELTARKCDARIAFISYVDTMWAPEKECIKNPDRFALLFAPIARKYLTSLDLEGKKGSTMPYERNQLRMPKTIEDCYAYLTDWRRTWKGTVFCYEYHFWINQYFDLGSMYFARRISEDIKSMVRAGIEGLIEDGSQRSFFPNGFSYYVYGHTLFDLGTDVDELAADYFAHAYGKHAEYVKHYLTSVTELFEFAYMKGEKSTDPATHGKFYDPARVSRMQEIIALCEGAKKYFEENYQMPHRVQTVSMQLLIHHAEYCIGIAKAMIPKCQADHEGAKQLYDAFFDEFGKRELEIERYFDHFLARISFKKIFEEQFQNSITQIIG